MTKFDWEDDGLDADGYPINPGPRGLRYIRGSEADAGDFKPQRLGETVSKIIRKVHLFSVDLSQDRKG